MVHFHYIFTENNFFTPLSIKIFCEETLPFGDSGIRLDIRSVKKPCRSDIRTFNFFYFYFNINITIKIKTWPKIIFWPHFVNKYIFFWFWKKVNFQLSFRCSDCRNIFLVFALEINENRTFWSFFVKFQQKSLFGFVFQKKNFL